MKKKLLSCIIVIVVIVLIALTKKDNSQLKIGYTIINNTSINQKTAIDIIYGSENTSNSYTLFSIKNIKSNSRNVKSKKLDNKFEDFGLIIKFDDYSTQSNYYSVSSNYTDINIVLEINQDKDNNTFIDGYITSKNKNFFFNEKTDTIKTISIKEEKNE